MNVQAIAAQYRLHGWTELVKERMASGQSVKAFCRENGISESTYYVRQKKVRIAACISHAQTQQLSEPQPVPTGWAVAEVPAKENATSLVVEIEGCRIEVTQSTDAELLAKTCRVLRSIC